MQRIIISTPSIHPIHSSSHVGHPPPVQLRSPAGAPNQPQHPIHPQASQTCRYARWCTRIVRRQRAATLSGTTSGKMNLVVAHSQHLIGPFLRQRPLSRLVEFASQKYIKEQCPLSQVIHLSLPPFLACSKYPVNKNAKKNR
ncbi:hypothetical protein LMH87_000099 [Akanthomyces muscarius]|uniref:Uncharacterized protein n=1 Tax=Akanthomyces muscarius TaxID=2231603 RepID=A0A9W8QGM6_AKAMU|nr:hypothetical protein LMH87_000099 [Akanthomyces muscarius]KAJ4154823.1 hypothetical protein LMH87_000099 [Akanthomyces muscarius]